MLTLYFLYNNTKEKYMTDKTIEIKEKIKDLMKKRNMSIYQLALKSGVSEACIRNWYSKRNYAPNLEPLQKVANALDIPFAQLFISENEKIYPIDKPTKKLLDDYFSLDVERRQLVADLIKQMKKNQ